MYEKVGVRDQGVLWGRKRDEDDREEQGDDGGDEGQDGGQE